MIKFTEEKLENGDIKIRVWESAKELVDDLMKLVYRYKSDRDGVDINEIFDGMKETVEIVSDPNFDPKEHPGLVECWKDYLSATTA